MTSAVLRQLLRRNKLLLLVNAMTREDIQEWLIWNDPNGLYSDKQSLKERNNVMKRNEALEIMLQQVEENRVL